MRFRPFEGPTASRPYIEEMQQVKMKDSTNMSEDTRGQLQAFHQRKSRHWRDTKKDFGVCRETREKKTASRRSFEYDTTRSRWTPQSHRRRRRDATLLLASRETNEERHLGSIARPSCGNRARLPGDNQMPRAAERLRLWMRARCENATRSSASEIRLSIQDDDADGR